MKKIEKKSPKCNIIVLPFVENIDELMDVSDVIVTKAGGMTVAESLAKNLPMIIIDPIPGQERMNTDHLLKCGAAIEIKEGSQLHEALDKLFYPDERINEMREKAKNLAKPKSAITIAQLAFKNNI